MIAVIVAQMLQEKRTPEEIGTACATAHTLAQRVRAAKAEIHSLERVHGKMMEDLKNTLEAIRAECDHPAASYHGDPSGNNDSHHECVVCGQTY